jgi:hypothetical protein
MTIATAAAPAARAAALRLESFKRITSRKRAWGDIDG